MPAGLRDTVRAEVASVYPGIFTTTATIRSQGRGNRRASQELFSTAGLNSATISALNERADSDLDDEAIGDNMSQSSTNLSGPAQTPRAGGARPSSTGKKRVTETPTKAPAKAPAKVSRKLSNKTRSVDRKANLKAIARYALDEARKGFGRDKDTDFEIRIGVSPTTYIPAPHRRFQVVLKQKPILLVIAAAFCVLTVIGVIVQLAKTVYGVYWLAFKPILLLLSLMIKLFAYLIETLSVGCALYMLASLPDLFSSYAREGSWRRAYLYASPDMNLGDVESPDVSQFAAEGSEDWDVPLEDTPGALPEDASENGTGGNSVKAAAATDAGARVTLTELVRSLFTLAPENYLICLRCSRVTSTLPELAISRSFHAGVGVIIPPFPEDALERILWCAQIVRFSFVYVFQYFAGVYVGALRLLCSSWAFVHSAADRATASSVAVATALALYSPLAPLVKIPLIGRVILVLRTMSFILLFVGNTVRLLAWQYKAWLRPVILSRRKED